MTWMQFCDKHFVGLCVTAVLMAYIFCICFSGYYGERKMKRDLKSGATAGR